MITAPRFQISPFDSPLAEFLQRLPAGARYALYPLGRYTRACFADAAEETIAAEGRQLVGFIDDAGSGPWQGKPVATLRDAAEQWRLDAILLLRDTADRALARRIDALRAEGLLDGVQIVDQPAPHLSAMLAHLETYHPACAYSPEFVASCRSAENVFHVKHSSLALTLDAEVFPYGSDADLPLFGRVMREFTRILADSGASATLCVQLEDTPGGMRATPPEVVQAFLDAFGPRSIGLHGWNHDMPADGYAFEWFERGLDALRTRYGVRTSYWAPPGWTLSWRTLRVLRRTPIRFGRGVWTGVNVRQAEIVETFRTPYRVGELWQIPYSYADWMFVDVDGRPQDWSLIAKRHAALAEFAAAGPCLIESVAHPFRFVGPDWRERLGVVRDTLRLYVERNVRISGVCEWLS
ncbi:MAG: hypothetical protein HZB38_16785 [Planctomycetes bacterium]|nr:hypothetical protein [Planctomycetota bacterium]